MLQKRTIMIVDDSAVCIELVSKALTECGYAVISVNSPFELASRLRESPPDLLLLDVTLPGIPGPDLLRIARRSGDIHFPILLHSDRPEPELAQLASSCGADNYVCKSPNPAALLRKVRQHIFIKCNERAMRPA